MLQTLKDAGKLVHLKAILFLCLLKFESSFVSCNKQLVSVPQIRIVAKYGEFVKTIYEVGNTETTLKPVYFNPNNTEENGWTRSSRFKAPIDSSKYTEMNVTFVYFECTASYPVEWIYYGSGWNLGRGNSPDRGFMSHKVVNRVVRVMDDKKKKNTTSLFLAQIGQLRLSEVMSGNYTCRSVLQPKLSSYFYVFVPYSEPKPRKTFVLDAPQTIRTDGNQTVILPCNVADSTAKVSLFHKRHKNSSMEIVPMNSSSFDPKTGFTLRLSDLNDPWGTYTCKEEFNKSMLNIHLLPFKENEVEVIPNTTHVVMSPEKLEVFECRAKEKISIMIDVVDAKLNVDYKMNTSSLDRFPYKAVAKIVASQLKRNHTMVKCIATESQRVLHTWEFTQYGNNSLTISYDEENRQYLCCTTSYHQPKFSIVFCGSELECRIRKGFYFFAQNAYSTKHFAPPGCSSVPVNIEGYGDLRKSIPKWPSPVVEGVMQCTVGIPGTEERKEVQFIHNHLTNYKTFRFAKDTPVPPGSQVMAIRQFRGPPNKLVGDIYVGDTIRFQCFAPSKYFAVGPTFYTSEIVSPPSFLVYRWAVQKKNATLKYIKSEACFFDTCDITFADRHTTGVLCFAPLRNSLTEERNFTLAIRVMDRPKKVKPRMILANGTSIVKVLNVKHNATVKLDAHFLGPEYKPGESKIQLECSAPYFIKWKYEGSGSPFVKVSFTRKAYNIKSQHLYNFTTTLEFVTLDEQSTGKYVCFSVDQPKESNSYYDVFVPGEKVFLSSTNRVINLYRDNESGRLRLTTIPCAVSNNTANVTLYKVEPITNTWQKLKVPPTLSYDPLRGFVFKEEEFIKLLGHYYCNDDQSLKTSGLITVRNGRLFPHFEARHSPGWSSRRMRNSTTQHEEKFRCEARENVTFTFSDDSKQKNVTYYTHTNTTQFPFGAAFTADLRDFLNFTQIECVTTAEKKVLHTWRLQHEGYFADRIFYFNETDNSYVCCKGVPNPSPMDYVPCTSHTECKINRACLRDKKCDHLSPAGTQHTKNETQFSGIGRGCVGFNVDLNPTGLLKCNDEEYFYFLGNYEECDYECQHFDEPKYQPQLRNSDVLGISQSPEGSIIPGSSVTFECFGSKFYFSGGFRWALQKSNGKTEYVVGEDNEEGSLLHSTLTMEFKDKSTKSIICYAPEWNSSTKWKSIPIEVSHALHE